MSDDVERIYLDPDDPAALFTQLNNELSAREYELLLGEGIKINDDPVRAGFGMAWILLRRREPGLSWSDSQDRIIVRFGKPEPAPPSVLATPSANGEVDPIFAAS